MILPLMAAQGLLNCATLGTVSLETAFCSMLDYHNPILKLNNISMYSLHVALPPVTLASHRSTTSDPAVFMFLGQ